MERTFCTKCKIEKTFEGLYKKYTECKNCYSNRSLKT